MLDEHGKILANVVVVFEVGFALLGQVLGDGGSQGGLTVIDVTYSTQHR